MSQAPVLALPELPADLKARFQNVGQHLPQLWAEGLIKPVHQKALLRCLIDKVVMRRSAHDQIEVRVIWKGGDYTTLTVLVTVGAFNRLSNAAAMERLIVDESQKGTSDEDIVRLLNAQGFRSPKRKEVLLSTVRSIRYKYRILHCPYQARPQRVAGYLTVPQIAKAIDVKVHWIYDRIHKGTITSSKKSPRGGSIFPDRPETLRQFKALKSGKLKRLDA
jgi:hypothetical protein